MKAEILKHQNLIDLALKGSGHAEAVFVIAKENGIGVTDVPVPGSILNLPMVMDAQMKSYYDSRGISPATGILHFGNIPLWLTDLPDVQFGNNVNVENNVSVGNTAGGVKYTPLEIVEYHHSVSNDIYDFEMLTAEIAVYTRKQFSQNWVLDLGDIGWDKAVVLDIVDLSKHVFLKNLPKHKYSHSGDLIKVFFPFAPSRGKVVIHRVK